MGKRPQAAEAAEAAAKSGINWQKQNGLAAGRHVSSTAWLPAITPADRKFRLAGN